MAAIVMVYDCVAFGIMPLVACTVTLAVPTALGVQLMNPVISLIAIPVGFTKKENVGAGVPMALTSYV